MPNMNNRVKVKCYVDSCHYWDQNNICVADTIEVDNQRFNPDMEIGTLGGGHNEADTSKATYCRTFKPKNM
ncbi:MAG TPA: DUF1540 domain-containing protein [Firmicutes bacterium]|uniref:DUF1540 domain-containing protein n=2 Tax=Capillibacterium thermochitinicola TaxID=2699427 RepID=A0A8J6LIY3_9FIRM|nr:DUF1540 domain-containing protein [Capillibacterium thermochitinicola]HHW12078.1 DUF1540 domain-containing protein [Bacillota bacterium]